MKESKTIKAYKGFDKNLCCRGFQYEVGKEYEMEGDIKVCERGFHACENPLDVFRYYDMANSRFGEVELSGEIDRDGDSTKVCSSKIKVVAELNLSGMIKLGIKWLNEATSINDVGGVYANDCFRALIGSSGNYANIGSSGNYAKIGSSGYYDKIGSSGNGAHIGSSGDNAQIGNSGDSARICSSGDWAQIGSSGNHTNIGSIGNGARICSSGDNVKICSSGNYDQIGSSGDCTAIESIGEYSVICCSGYNSVVKAKVGSWITLSEWKYDADKERHVPVCVKTEYVDGERIKADTWYRLVNGEFIEVNL